jgi:hypothetical protein
MAIAIILQNLVQKNTVLALEISGVDLKRATGVFII